MRVNWSRRLLWAVALGLAGCAAPGPESAAAPEWLSALIANAEAQPVTNPPSRILTGDFRGQTVYYRAPYCCDIPGTVYDHSGAVLCTADGGFTGRGDGRCPEFWASLTQCELLWRDPRGKSSSRDLCSAASPTQ